MYLKIQTGAEAGRNPLVVMVQSNDPVAIAAQLNSSIPGLLVDVNGTSPNRFLTFRSTTGFLQIFQTVGASDLGLVPGNYVPQQNWLLIGNVPWDPTNTTGAYSFTDPSGELSDYYYFTTLNPPNPESIPSVAFHAKNSQLPVCQVFGTVLEADGAQPIPGIRIEARAVLDNGQSDDFFSGKLDHTQTDMMGRWQLSLPQRCRILIEMKEYTTGSTWSKIFIVPKQASLGMNCIRSDVFWRLTEDFIVPPAL
jgi:hypothetical protein